MWPDVPPILIVTLSPIAAAKTSLRVVPLQLTVDVQGDGALLATGWLLALELVNLVFTELTDGDAVGHRAPRNQGKTKKLHYKDLRPL